MDRHASTSPFVALLAGLAAAGIGLSGARAQDGAAIGVSAPLTGYFDIIGEQVSIGATAASEGVAAAVSIVDDECTAEGGARAADALIAADIGIAIGFPCAEAFDAAMPKLAAAGIPVIVLGIQADGLTDQRSFNGWKLLRLAPRNSDEADAIVGYLESAWREVNFAIVDDGTLYGRQIAEAVRAELEDDNLKPVFTDTYRPQLQNQVALVRRLQKAGATHVFIGGDAFDAAVIGKDAADIRVPLTMAGGSAFVAPPTDGVLPDGTVLAALPDWLDRDAAAGLVAKLPENTAAADGYVAPAAAAIGIAMEGLQSRDASGHVDIDALTGRSFETPLGPVSFNGRGDIAANLFEVFRIEDGRMVPAANTGAIR